jgi:hypothetical protein
MYGMLNNQSTHGDIFSRTDCFVDKKRKKNWDNNIVNLGYYHWVQINWWTITWANCGHHRPWEAAMICFRLFSFHFMSIV